MLLSPSAKAVVDAYSEANDCYDETLGQIAAALRAVAEIVAPIEYEKVWGDGVMNEYEKENPIREKLLTIASELENAD